MPPKRYLFFFVTLVSAIATFVSAILVVAEQNEYSLQEAINKNQVTAEIRGITDNEREFVEPMLQITLRPQTFWPVRVVVPSKTRLKGSEPKKADVVTLQSQEMTLFLFPRSTMLFAYSLDYEAFFPDRDSSYQLEEQTPIGNELERVLDNISEMEFQDNRTPQLAVWRAYQDVELDTIGEKFQTDFSGWADKVDDVANANLTPAGATSYTSLWWVVLIFCLPLTVISGVGFFRGGNNVPLIKGSPDIPASAGVSSPSDQIMEGTRQAKGSPAARPTIEQRPANIPPEHSSKLIAHLRDWKRHATGGMAEVWIAYDKRQTPFQKFIVKFPRQNGAQVTPDTIKHRFDTEMLQHQKLKHLNIVQFIESGTYPHPESKQEKAYLIQEFIDGCTIKELLRKRDFNPLPDEVVFNIVDQLLSAFAYLHAQKIIHRDLSWSNIMIAQNTGHVYLIDFGNATAFHSETTKQKELRAVHTPPFNAPEKVENLPGRDFYALAVLIYAMCGGKDVVLLKAGDVTTEINQLEKIRDYPTWVFGILEWYLGGNHDDISMLKQDLSLAPSHQLAQLVKETMDQQ
ncbi:MAG: serine/threonine protein kinase [Ardenticatenaceae bacterium]